MNAIQKLQMFNTVLLSTAIIGLLGLLLLVWTPVIWIVAILLLPFNLLGWVPGKAKTRINYAMGYPFFWAADKLNAILDFEV